MWIGYRLIRQVLETHGTEVGSQDIISFISSLIVYEQPAAQISYLILDDNIVMNHFKNIAL
jgi:hypothetical protein